MRDGPRPKVDERDLLFRRCRVELMEMLYQFRSRYALTATEYLSLLAGHLAGDVDLLLRCERIANEPEGEA
jgi:hypothetical protein